MILVEWTPESGSLARLSTRDIALTYQWYGYITSIASIKFSTSKVYGGYAKPTFSDITISPEYFENDWPPAKTADVKFTQTETTEAAGVILIDGTAQRKDYDRNGAKYVLRQPEFSATTTASTAYADTLDNIVDTLCTALGITVDHTEERAAPPAVSYTVPKDIQAIDLLDDMCAYFTHAFKIVEGVLYLYDMLGSTTPVALTEFDVQPCSYKDGRAISLITGDVDSVTGSDANGDEVSISTIYATTGTNNTANLTNIKTLMEKQIATIKAKIDDDKPTILDNFTLLDESTVGDTNTSARVLSVIYNYDTLDMQIEAYGSVT